MGGKLKICGTCEDFTCVTSDSGHCRLTGADIFRFDSRPCWRSRRGNVIVTALVMAATALGIGLLLAGIWLAAVAGW
jgi:hypothetical protein